MSEAKKLTAYDAGLLSDYGGGNVEWWQDYIRAELERAHEFYADQFDAERAKVEALRDEKAAVEWMLEQDRAALAAAVTRATAAEAEAAAARDTLQGCAAHAAAALLQRAPSDDAIIMGHLEAIQRIARTAILSKLRSAT